MSLTAIGFRRWLRHTVAFSVLLAAIGTVVAVAWQGRTPRARIALASRDVFLGEGAPGDVIEGIIRVVNEGRAPLTISALESSCDCTVVSPEAPFTVAPRSAQDLRVGVHLRYEGERRSAVLRVVSDDPSEPQLTLRVGAAAPKVFIVSPPSIDFGSPLVGTTRQQVIQVFHPDGSAFSDPTGFEGTVTLASDAPVGPLQSEVVVRWLLAGRELMVPVSTNITRLVQTVPAHVFLEAGTNAHEVDVFFKRSDQRALGEFIGVEAPARVDAEEESDGLPIRGGFA
jgi:hypothetical protein